MTHLWKSKEVFCFDVPSKKRVLDVYWKNELFPIETFIRLHVPKVTRVKFDEKYLCVNVEVDMPKYPENHPHFTPKDVDDLLAAYMEYANYSIEEMSNWAETHKRKLEG